MRVHPATITQGEGRLSFSQKIAKITKSQSLARRSLNAIGSFLVASFGDPVTADARAPSAFSWLDSDAIDASTGTTTILSQTRTPKGIHHRSAEQRNVRPSSRRGPQPKDRARARARSAVASTGPGLCVRFVPNALSGAGFAELLSCDISSPGDGWGEDFGLLTSPRSVNCCPFRVYAHHPKTE